MAQRIVLSERLSAPTASVLRVPDLVCFRPDREKARESMADPVRRVLARSQERLLVVRGSPPERRRAGAAIRAAKSAAACTRRDAFRRRAFGIQRLLADVSASSRYLMAICDGRGNVSGVDLRVDFAEFRVRQLRHQLGLAHRVCFVLKVRTQIRDAASCCAMAAPLRPP